MRPLTRSCAIGKRKGRTSRSGIPALRNPQRHAGRPDLRFMSFLFPTLLAVGLPLVAVPIAIHLINLRRQQRIRWAAMQFLIESQRRNRRWILLKQLLLLLARMTAIAVLLRSEEHTSELQSLRHLVCRLLLEKKKDSNILSIL